MKVVILCGGRGLRMNEVTEDLPKPLVPIAGKPMLWHIVKIYSYYGFNDFVMLLGYKGEKIKEYFVDYKWKNHSFVLTEDDSCEVFEASEKWNITFLDTGLDAMTGSRIKKAQQVIGNEPFMLTYGDGLADINLSKLLAFHQKQNKIATVTGIKRANQYGVLSVSDNTAVSFMEKPETADIINGGFFVLNSKIFSYLTADDNCVFEQEPLEKLVQDRELAVYRHEGFWTAADTYKDILTLNNMWNESKALWKVW